jgi:hypothetical protein
MNGYVTTFDSGYLSRAIVLAESFARHAPGERLYLCCMDEAAHSVVKALSLPGTTAVAHAEFAPAALAGLRARRSAGEYCWTAKPFILEHVLAAEPQIEWAVYLDTDMMVFSDPSAPLAPLAGLDALFTPHNLSQAFAGHAATVGRFNAGYAAFRNSGAGRTALAQWRRLCVESVSVVPTADTFADQKYLDHLAARWRCEPGRPLPGLNAAPWNVGNYRVEARNGSVLIDGEPLVVYHFQGLRIIRRPSMFDLYVGSYKLPAAARTSIYAPYAAQLRRAEELLAARFPEAAPSRGPTAREWIRTARRALSGNGNLMLARSRHATAG